MMIKADWWWGWTEPQAPRPRLRHLYVDCVGIQNHLRVAPQDRPVKGSGMIDTDAANVCRLCKRRWRAGS